EEKSNRRAEVEPNHRKVEPNATKVEPKRGEVRPNTEKGSIQQPMPQLRRNFPTGKFPHPYIKRKISISNI
ncbi:hypothetical protein, partial [Sporolactobacillus nakayamae]|uniref:hypothetical protein n=1 Tax=Sporolactobacillus nakayamae TaxID=269670 RepID=UPI001C432380